MDPGLSVLADFNPVQLARSDRLIHPGYAYTVNNTGRAQGRWKECKESILTHSLDADTSKLQPPAEYKECPALPYRRRAKTEPDGYIKYAPPTAGQLDETVEYEQDGMDNLWLKAVNEGRPKKSQIDPDLFCQIIDRLEKESKFQPKKLEGYLSKCSEDDLCTVCNDAEDDDCNKILYCDMCNVAVHQECYGVPCIPEGSWMCRRCKLSPSATVKCLLCPNTGGAFKTTVDNNWAHVICAIWLNEVHFLNPIFLEPIEGHQTCLAVRSKLKCLICSRKQGACVQCSHKSCARAFHVTCAQAAGLCMNVSQYDDSDASEKVDVQRKLYCPLHEPDEQGNPKKIYARNDPHKEELLKAMEIRFRAVAKELRNKKHTFLPINVPSISQDNIDAIAKKFRAEAHMKKVVDYWYLKRKQRCGVPLIPRLQAELESRNLPTLNPMDDPSISDKLHEFRAIRSDVEKLRMLAEMCKKREAYKLEHWTATCSAFAMAFKPPSDHMEELLTAISKRDAKDVFAEPVENTVSGYRRDIPKPMDLKTMRSKLENGRYNTIDDLRNDYVLMCNNCEKFNTKYSNPYYVDYVKKYRRKCDAIFANFEERINCSDSCIKNDTEGYTKEICRMNFYEGSGSAERVKENAPIGMGFENRPRQCLTSEDEPEPEETKPVVNLFLQHPKATPVLNIINRKRAAQPLLSSARRRKIEAPDPRQASITKFFTSENKPPVPGSTERMQTRNHPFESFRQNSVVSPKTEAVSSAEYSTEDDTPMRKKTRPDRSRRSRIAPQPRAMNSLGLYHNDIVHVTVPGDIIIGRYLDECNALADPSVPPIAKEKLRKGGRPAGEYLYILPFTDQQAGEWQPHSRIRLYNFDNAPPVPRNNKQLRLATEFRNRIQSQALAAK
ncbi:unnamed protein product, partial [Mesorhabditis spiculigera]